MKSMFCRVQSTFYSSLIYIEQGVIGVKIQLGAFNLQHFQAYFDTLLILGTIFFRGFTFHPKGSLYSPESVQFRAPIHPHPMWVLLYTRRSANIFAATPSLEKNKKKDQKNKKGFLDFSMTFFSGEILFSEI